MCCIPVRETQESVCCIPVRETRECVAFGSASVPGCHTQSEQNLVLEGVLTVEMSLCVFEMPFSVFLFVQVLTSECCVVCCLICVVCFLSVVFLCCVFPVCSASILSPGALLLLAVFIFFFSFLSFSSPLFCWRPAPRKSYFARNV